jgi:hypothetical protein
MPLCFQRRFISRKAIMITDGGARSNLEREKQNIGSPKELILPCRFRQPQIVHPIILQQNKARTIPAAIPANSIEIACFSDVDMKR